MDLGDKKESSSSSPPPPLICGDSDDQANENEKKCCADCRTTRTPLWRGGPSGPKSLCNACGIRYRKNMVSVMRWSKGNERIKREKIQTHNYDYDGNERISTISANTNTSSTTNERLKVKMNFMALVKKQKSPKKTKLGEEEQAAVLLMALSCGSAFA